MYHKKSILINRYNFFAIKSVAIKPNAIILLAKDKVCTNRKTIYYIKYVTPTVWDIRGVTHLKTMQIFSQNDYLYLKITFHSEKYSLQRLKYFLNEVSTITGYRDTSNYVCLTVDIHFFAQSYYCGSCQR